MFLLRNRFKWIKFSINAHYIVSFCCRKAEPAFSGAQICQPEADAKQRCRQSECERAADAISQLGPSLADKTSRCAAQNKRFTPNLQKPLVTKYAPLSFLYGSNGLSSPVGVRLLKKKKNKANTRLLIAEKDIILGLEKSSLQM